MPLHEPVNPTAGPVPEETNLFNQKIIETIEAGPDPWQLDKNMVRTARREGKGIFPLEAFDPQAETFEIPGKDGAIEVRAIRPDSMPGRGIFLHIHGGGWIYGNADMQDQRLKEIANQTGLICLSVEYRLAPENPYPAAPDDCEAAALWLLRDGAKRFDTSFLAIGGESAGAQLAAVTLLRLRDKHHLTPFHAAVLMAGIFDLGMTPSVRKFHHKLILNYDDLVQYSGCFLQSDEDRRNPDISPLYASLHDMPPAHFSIGTMDPLLDDTMFMSNCWIQQQSDTELDIFPGGCHVFQYFEELQQARVSRANIIRFLNRQIEKHATS